MKVHEAMTDDVMVATPGQSIRDAAKLMAQNDIGALPVAEDDRLVGMITDRDIAVRAVAEGLGPDTPVADVMSREMLYCFEDEALDDVASNMGQNQVRRLPVLSRDKRLVGIVAVGDLSQKQGARTIGKAVAEISSPGGAHSQTRH
jgi:CBS domain-containing protein